MGITTEQCLLYETCNSKTATCAVRKPDEGCPVYRYFKELIIQNYPERLKADMVAMLTELSKKVDAMPINPKAAEAFKLGQETAYERCELLIQQKINVLKADQEGKNESKAIYSTFGINE